MLAGGEPYRLLRLSPAGVDALETGAAGLPTLLVPRGLAHPVPEPRPPRPGELVVVVPVLDDPAGLGRLLAALEPTVTAVVVVDDGSAPATAEEIAGLAAAFGARLIRRDSPGGPAAARDAGRGEVGDARLIGFLDTDAVPSPGWLDHLLGHFDDGRVGAVAPRVTASPGPAPPWLARYEAEHSPLDLGGRPGIVGAHRRLSYVPTAALVCRRAALDEVGWFDASLRVGEDVDLLRRLEEAGWVTRYEPAATVGHDCRPSLWAFATQRFGYGRSAASLERRHPGTVAPFEASPWSTTLALAGLTCAATAGSPRARRAIGLPAAVSAAALWALPSVLLRRRLVALGLDRGEAGRVSGALVARGAGWATGGLLTAIRRVWWPAVALAAVPRRTRRPVLFLLGLARLSGTGRRAVQGGGLSAAVALVDDLAYGAGVWTGCVEQRSLGALVPRSAASVAIGAGEPGSSTGPAAPAGRS